MSKYYCTFCDPVLIDVTLVTDEVPKYRRDNALLSVPQITASGYMPIQKHYCPKCHNVLFPGVPI